MGIIDFINMWTNQRSFPTNQIIKNQTQAIITKNKVNLPKLKIHTTIEK